MKVRLPKSNAEGSMRDLAAKMQKVQAQMEKIGSQLEEKVYSFTAGGGTVKAEVKGTMEILNLEIDKEMLDDGDLEMLKETVIAAINGAIKMAKDEKESAVAGVSGNLDLPLNIPGLS